MKSRIYIIFVSISCLWFAFGLSARNTAGTGRSYVQPQEQRQAGSQEPDKIYGTALEVRSDKLGDSIVRFFVGDVVLYHNGTVITCDSAIWYNSSLVAGFKNVIVHNADTYIYGDKLDYNRITSTATVYAPLVKTVDKDAVMYTYNMSFNTDSNVGFYTGGGTMLQADNRFESEAGYYYSDLRELVGVGNVQMRSPEYEFASDSVRYDMNAQIAYFNSRSYMWNADGDFLTALRGSYDTENKRYAFTEDSYIMRATQEVWADTITYDQATGDALLLSNIQVVDTAERAMVFADLARYWGEQQNILLARRPSLVRYDPIEDTIFMRADSMFLFSSLREEAVPADSLNMGDVNIAMDSLTLQSHGADSITSDERQTLDSIVSQPVVQEMVVPPTKKELKAERARLAAEAKEQRRKEKAALKEAQRAEKGRRLAKTLREEHDHDHDAAEGDSVAPVEVPVISGVVQDSVPAQEQDSMIRVVKAYYNVKVFRNDFQAVCDSMVGFSVDSTLHMYNDPLIWNGDNQIQSLYVDIYTRDQTINRAEFFGDPIMSSYVEPDRFNQIKGREIKAFFRNGEIFRTDVDGNAQNYYYLEDQEDSLTSYVTAFVTMESAEISYYFSDGDITGITWVKNPDFEVISIELLTDEQPQILPGFKWQIERKPTKEEVFDRKIRNSQRSEYEFIPKPSFPLTGRMDEQKKVMLQDGTWIDRIDDISPNAKKYVNGIDPTAFPAHTE